MKIHADQLGKAYKIYDGMLAICQQNKTEKG